MAVMGLKINSPSNNFAIKTSMADDFVKAMFGDPEMEIKFRRLQSDLVNDEYYRRAQEAATQLNEAKRADQEWRTRAGQEGGDVVGTMFQDAQGQLDDGSGGVNPVIVENPDQVPVPAVRPYTSADVGPDRYASPVAGRPGGPISVLDYYTPPVAGRPGGPISTPDYYAGSPVAGRPGGPLPGQPADQPDAIPPLEPDLRLSTFPRVSDYLPPDRGPELGTRPGEFPEMPAPIGEFDPESALPYDVESLLGMRDRPMPSGAVKPSPYGGDPDISRATPNQFITLSDVINYFTGQEGMPERAPVAVAPAGPVDPRENTLDYVPEPSQPSPDTIPLPPETPMRSSSQGVVTEIPGRVLPGPFPPRPGGPIAGAPADVPPELEDPAIIPGVQEPADIPPDLLAPIVLPGEQLPADVPPPVTPQVIPGQPYQGPPVPLPETPDVATGETDVRGPDPQAVTLRDKSGTPRVRLNGDQTRALGQMIVANGGDVAGAVNKMMGGIGLQYGDIDDSDRMRLNYALTGGNLTTTTQINSRDRTAIETARDIKANEIALDPKSGFQTDQAGGDRVVSKDENGNTIVTRAGGPGALSPAPIIHDVSKGETPLVVTTDAQGNVKGTPLEGAPAVAPENNLGGSDNEQALVLTALANKMDDPTYVPTKDEARAYAIVVSKLGVAHDDIRQADDPDRPGSKMTIRVPVPPMDLSYLPSKEEVLAKAGLVAQPSQPQPQVPAPAPAPVSPQTAAQPEVVSPPTAAATEQAPAPAPIPKKPFDPQNPDPTAGPAVGTQADGKIYGTGGYEIIVPSSPAQRAEFDKRAWMWLREAASADKMLKQTAPPPWYRDWAAHATSGTTSPDLWSAMIHRYGTDNRTKQFLSQSSTFINSEGRINSGAAIQPFENVELGWRFVNSDGDDPTTRSLKAVNRKVSMDSMYDALALDGKMTAGMIADLKHNFGYERNVQPTDLTQPQVLRMGPQTGVLGGQ